MWEATRAHAGLLRSWPTAPGRPGVCPALSITSYKDKQCPLSQKSWPIGQGRHIHRLLPEAYEVLGTRRADGHSQGPGLLLANPQDTTGKSGAPPPEARRLGSLGMAQPALLKPLVSS